MISYPSQPLAQYAITTSSVVGSGCIWIVAPHDFLFSYLIEIEDSRPPPVITQSPHNLTISISQSAELQCKASGNPSPTIRWTHGNRPVLVDSRISINGGNLRITGDTSPSLYISMPRCCQLVVINIKSFHCRRHCD